MTPRSGQDRTAADAAARDRDATGRARNARPRDALGRPLGRDAVSDLAPADDAARPPAEALATAQRLLDEGLPFHAHEVLETAWKAAPLSERDLWQGLAQVAVGLTHARRGNARGAVALLGRGRDRLAGYPTPGPHDVDVGGILTRCDELAARIRTAGTTSLAEPDLQVQLIRPARQD